MGGLRSCGRFVGSTGDAFAFHGGDVSCRQLHCETRFVVQGWRARMTSVDTPATDTISGYLHKSFTSPSEAAIRHFAVKILRAFLIPIPQSVLNGVRAEFFALSPLTLPLYTRSHACVCRGFR